MVGNNIKFYEFLKNETVLESLKSSCYGNRLSGYTAR